MTNTILGDGLLCYFFFNHIHHIEVGSSFFLIANNYFYPLFLFVAWSKHSFIVPQTNLQHGENLILPIS